MTMMFSSLLDVSVLVLVLDTVLHFSAEQQSSPLPAFSILGGVGTYDDSDGEGMIRTHTSSIQ